MSFRRPDSTLSIASPRRTRAVPRRHRGATLIEILVAIVVLSVGLLGMAGLQMTGLQSNHSAYLRSQASVLAYDLIDRMRAQRAAALGGSYADGTAGDRANWDASLAQILGADAVGNLAVNGARVTVTIQWNDNRGRIKSGGDTGTTDTQTFVYRTEL